MIIRQDSSSSRSSVMKQVLKAVDSILDDS